ncbi:protein translocase subunit SecF [Patescibacteria group bacterium AH-259-L07]|nr:protein translocase subunit SecF [Patescibacteria group bacterium AH-259-L07]
MFNFVSHRNIFFIISGTLLTVSILSLLIFGLKPGIDFTGGSMMEIEYTDATLSSNEIQERLFYFEIGKAKIQETGEKGYLIRFKDVDEKTHQEILTALDDPEEVRFESIGPVIGKELTQKAQWAIALALIAIILYIAWAFRKISKIAKKGESWRYGLGALLALFHDVIILLGFFALMGYFKGAEINTAFITALLTVLGYSVNDTIVIYDRIRENLLTHSFKTMEEAINVSLNQTIVRSLNTSLTTLFVLLVIYLFGGSSIQNFVLAMMVGIGVGTYSSIAIASQFLLFKRTKGN